MELREKLEEIGKKILETVRTTLFMDMRFMGPALSSLDFTMDLSTRTIGTDAAYIRYNPEYLRRVFIEESNTLNRAYIHMLLHCLFRHMYTDYGQLLSNTNSGKNSEVIDSASMLWDLSCDIAAEYVLDSMDYPCLLRVSSDFRDDTYKMLKENVGIITAERVFKYLRDADNVPVRRLQHEFTVDDHSFWDKLRKKDNESDKRKNDLPDQTLPDIRLNQNPDEIKWKKTAIRVEQELAAIQKLASKESGRLDRMLRISTNRKSSLRDYLKKFMVIREVVETDPDSFDYGLYNFGMTFYGNMPIIEENEFTEKNRIDELVLAIDTSGSTQSGLVRQFLNETGAILNETGLFFRSFKLHIIECDDRVQSDIVIADVNDLKKYTDEFQVSGGYGTDFRPVFNYVNDLISQKELSHLKGLIYFTDGYGEYPSEATTYETAFVFPDSKEYDDSKVPEWAVKLYL